MSGFRCNAGSISRDRDACRVRMCRGCDGNSVASIAEIGVLRQGFALGFRADQQSDKTEYEDTGYNRGGWGIAVQRFCQAAKCKRRKGREVSGHVVAEAAASGADARGEKLREINGIATERAEGAEAHNGGEDDCPRNSGRTGSLEFPEKREDREPGNGEPEGEDRLSAEALSRHGEEIDSEERADLLAEKRGAGNSADLSLR